MKKKCAFCGAEFEDRRNICCSRSCAAKLRLNDRGMPAWTKEEVDYLKELVGSYPLKSIVTKFNRWAKSNNKPSRTHGSIATRVRLLGLTLALMVWLRD